MTDTNPIVELPICGRRWLGRNDAGTQIWCRPPTRPPGLSDAEALKDAAKWFKKRKVSCAECLACASQEPVQAPQSDLEIMAVADPIVDGMPVGRDLATGEPTPKAPEILDDGTIVYEKTGWEPPPVPPGYKRQSDNLQSPYAWILVRKEPLCKHCKLVRIHRGNCDCLRVIPTCTYRGKAENIQMDQCASCPDKK